MRKKPRVRPAPQLKRKPLSASRRQPDFAGQTPAQQKISMEATERFVALRRKLCTVMQFWLVCGRPRCRRDHACRGDAPACYTSHWDAMTDADKAFFRALITGARASAAPARRPGP